MARSIKKGPYIDQKLVAKIEAMNKKGGSMEQNRATEYMASAYV